jgi:hypothetical protein
MKPEMLEAILERSRQNLRDSGSLLPVFFLGTGDNFSIVGTPFTDDRSKDQALRAVKEIANTQKADYLVFISECWSVASDRGKEFLEGQAAGKWRSVSDCPFKKEIVSVMIENRDGSADRMGCADVITGPDGKKTFGEIKYFEGAQSSGRFTRILGPKVVRDGS